jgi:hypothetical protein
VTQAGRKGEPEELGLLGLNFAKTWKMKVAGWKLAL